MKTILLILLLPFTAFAQGGAYHLSADIPAWKGADTVLLTHYAGRKQVNDTTIAHDGKFEFNGVITEPESVA